MDINELKDQVNKYLNDYFINKEGYNKKIYDSMSYSINIGGKRIRPLLMILTYSMYKDDYNDILPVAAAIEMIHTYSLIHDDLPAMDNDDLRRGRPTNHKVFGDAIAVLAGDSLLNEAMNIMFDYALNVESKDAVKACGVISKAAGADGMIGGQVVDILSEGRNIGIDELRYMQSKKTGALIKASIISGAILAGAAKDDIIKLDKFGEKLGLAFQIKDDILDIIGDEKKLGKKVNVDAQHNKNNYISFYGVDECSVMCKRLTSECIDILNSIDRNSSELQYLTRFLLEREN